MGKTANIPTRYALIKRMEKLLKEIDDYFDDAHAYGLSPAEADPKGEMMAWRKAIVASLQREGRLKISAASTRANDQ